MKQVSAKVKPGARRESIREGASGRYEIAVREKAERNQANLRVAELLALHLGVAQTKIRMIKGHRGSIKVFAIE